jgi:putative pyoverdin transport system ATP-binding/permease protein
MRSLRLFVFLMRESRSTMVLMTLAGVLSGLFSVAVIAIIGRGLHPGSLSTPHLALAFAALVIAKVASGAVARLLLTRFSQGTILDLSLRLCTRILASPLRRLEKEGTGRVLAVLTDDVSSVTWAIQCLPQLATNIAIVVGCGAYLAWLSWQMFLWGALVTVVGAVVYKIINDRAFRIIHEARDARSRLFDGFRTLTSGLKELMMHRGRREDFVLRDLRPAAEAYRASNLAATTRHTLAEAWVQLLLYGLIGALLFAFPAFSMPSVETLTSYVFAVLYVMGPLWAIIGTLPAVMRGQVAMQKIEDLGVSLAAVDDSGSGPTSPFERPGSAALEMTQVTFKYESPSASDRPFALGPIDFRLAAGELVFLIGGNGSGKSTFVKVLTGLYAPQAGTILLNEVPVVSANQAIYREWFSVVFSDFHIFEKLLGLSSPDQEAAARRHLKLLAMDDRVEVKDGGFSSVNLSQGQRKRLALITAYLEDRPFYVFDEWAADQDPEYKHIFYSKLLPELRARGKGVVVITHDDRYFSHGDRVLKLEDGRIVPDRNPLAEAPRTQAEPR